MSNSDTKQAVMTAIVPVSDDGRTFTNLDGVQVTLGDWALTLLDWAKRRGYTDMRVCRGDMGATELALHCRISQRIAICAFTKPEYKGYAFVLLDDGSMHEGCFHQFSDGRISLS